MTFKSNRNQQIKSQPTNQIATNKSKSNQLLARLAFEEIPA